MKDIIIKLAIFFMVILFFSGCALNKKAAPIAHEKSNEKISNSYKSESGYYYFIEAQLQKKKSNLSEAINYLIKAIEKDPESLYLKRELAILYLYQKDNQKALNVVEGILKKDPNDVKSLIIYGQIKQSLDHIDDAKKAYERVIAIDPKQRNIYLYLGALYMEENDLNSALKVYGSLIQNFPDSYAGHFFIGKIHAAQGNIEEAEKKFQKTLELEPRLEEPRYELLSIYKSLGKKKKIIQTYKDILKRNPNNIRAAMELGYFYHEIGMLNESENLLKDLGIKSLSDQEVIRKLVQLYLDQKKYDAAIIILKGMLKGVPNSSNIHYIAGIVYDKINDKDMAIMHLKKVKPDSNFYQNSVVHISFLYEEQGKIKEAIDFLEGAIKNLPANPDILLYLALFYEETGEFEESVKVLKHGLDIDADNAKLYFRLGVVYDKWGKKAASIEAMKTVIHLEPNNANALNYLGYTYADLGENLDEAERLIQEALKYKPDDGYITDSLGWVYFKKGLFKKALKILEQAVSLVSDDPIILEHLGDAYMKVNDKKKALEIYKRALLLKTNKDKADLEKKIQDLEKEQK